MTIAWGRLSPLRGNLRYATVVTIADAMVEPLFGSNPEYHDAFAWGSLRDLSI